MRWLLKKSFFLFFSLFVIITLTFALMKFVPGDPFSNEKALPPTIYQSLLTHYGLNDPWYVQYKNYLISVLRWDFGPSFIFQGRSVNDIIREGFPISATLGVEALFLALIIGISFGIISALKQNHSQDHVTMIIMTLALSVPSFILATLLQYLFAIKLGILPVARWGTFIQSILPTLSLAAMPTAFIARQTRNNMIHVLKQDYIKTAISKGLPLYQIVFKHCLKNALAPLLPYFGQLCANILVGSFIIEKIFAIPGLGRWFVESVSNRDYTVIMGTTIFYSILLLTILFLADMCYIWIDPRVKKTFTNEES